jgi:hypothetical protein
MKLKEYKNKLSNNKEHPHFYSTPNYMGFADALYVSKYGEVGKGGVLKLNKTQNHYNKTMEKWTGYLNEGGFRSLDDVVHNMSGVTKALHTSFNIVPRTKNTTGGSRGGGGGNDGRRDNMNLNKPTLLMYGAGENKFKPMLFVGGSALAATGFQGVVGTPTSRQGTSGNSVKVPHRSSPANPGPNNNGKVSVGLLSTNKWSEAVQRMKQQRRGNPYHKNAPNLAATAFQPGENTKQNNAKYDEPEQTSPQDEPYTPFTQHNGFDGLKFDKDGKLYVDMNRNKSMDEKVKEVMNPLNITNEDVKTLLALLEQNEQLTEEQKKQLTEEQKKQLTEEQKEQLKQIRELFLKLSQPNWKEWKSDASMVEHVRMMFHYCNINPNPTVILPHVNMFASYIAHEMKTLGVKNLEEKIKTAIIKVTNELNNAKCNLICESRPSSAAGGSRGGGGGRCKEKTSYKYKNNTASYKYKYNNKKGGASHQLEPTTDDTHTVIGYSNHNSYFKYNAHFGPMEDSVRQAVLSKFDQSELLTTDTSDACIKHTREFRFMYIISAVLNYIGGREIPVQLTWIRGGMFMTAYTWTVEFENALNKTIIDHSKGCKKPVTSKKNPFIKCMFQLTHLAEDEYNFGTNAGTPELEDRPKFIQSFNEWSKSAISHHNADPSRFVSNILVPEDLQNISLDDKTKQWTDYINQTKIRMILCHGGETFWLNRRLKKSGLMQAIQQNKQVIWSGSSAGIINCGVTTGLAASKRYSQITNPTRHPTVALGDDPIPILGHDGNDFYTTWPQNVLPTDENKLTINKPPYKSCDFTGAGVYPGIVFPHCTSISENQYVLYPLMNEQIIEAIDSVPKEGVNGKKIEHVEILSDKHMFLYHQGESITYPPVDYDVGIRNKDHNSFLKNSIDQFHKRIKPPNYPYAMDL